MVVAEQPSPLLLDYQQPYSNSLYPSSHGLYMNAPSNLSSTSLYQYNNSSPMVSTYQNQTFEVECNYLTSPTKSTFEETSIASNIPLPTNDEDDSEVLTGLGLYDDSAEDSAPMMLTEEWTPPPESEEDAEGDDEDEDEEDEEEESGSPTEVEPRTPEQAPQALLPEQTGGKTYTPATYWWVNQTSNQYISEPQIQGQHHQAWQGVL
jgi:hypothetical protein